MRERERDWWRCVRRYGMRELNSFLRFGTYFSAFCTVKIDSASVSSVARRSVLFSDLRILCAIRARSGERKYPIYQYYLFSRGRSFLIKFN